MCEILYFIIAGSILVWNTFYIQQAYTELYSLTWHISVIKMMFGSLSAILSDLICSKPKIEKSKVIISYFSK